VADPWRNRIVGSGFEDPGQLLASPDNLRIHPLDQREALEGVLEAIGWIEQVTVNVTTGHVVDGHLRVALALSRGEPAVPVEYVEITAEEERLALALLDPISALAESSPTAFEALMGSVDRTVLAAGLAAMLEGFAKGIGVGIGTGDASEGEDGPGEPDPAEVLQEKWHTASGQLWVAGNHRLMIGDSRDPQAVAALFDGELADLLWTDPPYGVDYEGKTADALTIDNDDLVGLPDLLARTFRAATPHLVPSAPFYIAAPAGRHWLIFVREVKAAGWRLERSLVWMKDSMVLGHSDYHYRHENVLYGATGPGELPWFGKAASTVLDVDRPKRSELHPTTKPTELVTGALENSTEPGALVYDCFGGSGTTLIACELSSRRGRAMELLPKYAAVALERLADLKPELQA
jgi:DNA modification methylase